MGGCSLLFRALCRFPLSSPKDTISAGVEVYTAWSESSVQLWSGDLCHIGRLRPLLSLDNLKLHLVAFLQALIALGSD